MVEIPKVPLGPIKLRDHVERTGLRRGGLADDSCFLHYEKLGLQGDLAAGFAKDWRTRDGGEVVNNPLLWSGGGKHIGREDVRVLQEKPYSNRTW